MTKYISILRGINVSGQKKILMADLKTIYENLKLKNITTYIQSGNVVFETNSKVNLQEAIEKAIFKTYGFEVPVIVIEAEEFKQNINANPFIKEKAIALDKLHVTFLEDAPSVTNSDALKSIKSSEDRYILNNKIVYLYCPGGYGTTKLSNTSIENKLKVKATTRNWKTCNELLKIIETYS